MKPLENALRRFRRLSVWNLLSAAVFGAIISWYITDYFHRESLEDHRRLLLNNALFEMRANCSHDFYRKYLDTITYREAGSPFEYQETINIDELYRNLYLYDTDDTAVIIAFRETLIRVRFLLAQFNDNVRMRNNYILIDLKNVKKFNPGVFKMYHSQVMPAMKRFSEFIEANREQLVE